MFFFIKCVHFLRHQPSFSRHQPSFYRHQASFYRHQPSPFDRNFPVKPNSRSPPAPYYAKCKKLSDICIFQMFQIFQMEPHQVAEKYVLKFIQNNFWVCTQLKWTRFIWPMIIPSNLQREFGVTFLRLKIVPKICRYFRKLFFTCVIKCLLFIFNSYISNTSFEERGCKKFLL